MNYVQHTTTVAVVCKCESFYSARSLLLNFVIQFSLCVCVYNFRNHLSICSKKLARSDNIKLLTTKMEIINVVLTAGKQSIWYGWMDIQSKENTEMMDIQSKENTENDLKLPICYLSFAYPDFLQYFVLLLMHLIVWDPIKPILSRSVRIN